MARYVLYGKYTAEALAIVRREGYASREQVMRTLGESVGGEMLCVYWMPSLEWDFISIVEVPSAAAAFAALTVAGSTGAMQRLDAVEVLSTAEADEAIGRPSNYRAPGAA